MLTPTPTQVGRPTCATLPTALRLSADEHVATHRVNAQQYTTLDIPDRLTITGCYAYGVEQSDPEIGVREGYIVEATTRDGAVSKIGVQCDYGDGEHDLVLVISLQNPQSERRCSPDEPRDGQVIACWLTEKGTVQAVGLDQYGNSD